MPQLSGIDMLEKLRATTRGKEIPVIVLTNLSEKDEEEKAKDLGVKEYLLKANLTPSEVVEKVKKYLGKE
jgi:CheY-like chemotaxis protein